MRIRAALCLLLTQLILFQQLAFAHSLNGQTANVSSRALIQSARSVNLDLTSTKALLAAASLGLKSAISIQVGKQLESINSASLLTPAEFIAAYQMTTTGNQYLQLSTQGNASGGRFSIPLSLSQSLGNLVIPQGVKMLDNVALSPTLVLSGNLVDAGKLLVFSNNAQASSFTIDTNNIFIAPGGVFTSATRIGTVAAIDLTLNARGNIVNYGAISSSGNLALTAGGMINNSGASAIVQANNNINLNAASGNLTNDGMISALAGSINISAASTSNIAFNNFCATLSALNGVINFRDPNYNGTAGLRISGGNYLSQALNLYDGSGSVEMAVDQVSGVVNTYAGCAHISANTADLQIGTFDVSGDPWINNSGNLDLGGTIAGPISYLVATAGGSIYSSAAGESIDTSAAGGNVVLAAGVTAVDTSGAISLTRSGTGGDIVLTAGQTIDGNATQDITGFTTGGGNVALIAMTDGTQASTNGGHVLVPAAVTITSTSASGSAGAVTILAEASAGTTNAVSLGGVNAGGAGGAVTIRSATANLAGATIDDSTGIITGSFDSSTLQSGTLAPGAVVAGGALALATNGTINLSGTNTATSTALTATSLYLPNGTSLATTAGSLSIMAAINNLTIIGDNSGTASLSAVGGQLNIGASSVGSALFTAETPNNATTFSLDSDTLLTINAGSETLNQNVTLQNTSSTANWSFDSPAIAFETNSSISINSSILTLTVNNGELADNIVVKAHNVAINSSGTLTISGDSTFYVYNAQPLVISASTSIDFSNGASIDVAANFANSVLTIQTPEIILGTSTQYSITSASLSSLFGTINIEATSNQTGSFALTVLSGVQQGVLYTSARNTIVTSNSVQTAANSFLITSENLTINAVQSASLSSLINYSGNLAVNATNGSVTILPNSEIVACNGSVGISSTSWMSVGQNVLIDAGDGTVNMNGFDAPSKAPHRVLIENLGGIVNLSSGVGLNSGHISAIIALQEDIDLGSNLGFDGGDAIVALPFGLLTSLDLTNSQVFEQIEKYQSYKLIGGSFTPKTPNGQRTVTLTPAFVSPVIYGENIPSGFTVTLNGFGAANALSIFLGPTDTTNVISGIEDFVGNGVTIIIGTDPGTGLTVAAGGQIYSTGSFALYSNGNVVLNGQVNAKSGIVIATQPDSFGNSSISIGGTIASPTSSIVLAIQGAGNILETTNTAAIQGRTVELATQLGGIGSSNSAFTLAAANLQLVTSSNGTGSANIYDTTALDLSSASIGGSLQISDKTTLTLGNINTDDGSILVDSPGKISIATASKLIATDGNIEINSLSSTGGITVGQNVDINATGTSGTGGDVSIWIGSTSPSQTNTNRPANITANITNNGNIFYGANSISAKLPTNSISANDATVTFNTGSLKYNSITLSGGVKITATQSASFEDSQTTSTELIVDTGDESGNTY